MRTSIIGCGAMGSVYGGLLARAGFDITLIDPSEDHIKTIERDGLEKSFGVRPCVLPGKA